MLNRMVEKAQEGEILCREDTPTEQRVLGAFPYHAGLPYRQVEQVVERSYEAVRQRYQRLSHLFYVDGDHRTVAVDETKVKPEDEGVYVRAAVDTESFTNRRFVSHQTARRFETFEVIHVDVSRGRSGLVLFLRGLPKRCRGKPLVKADRGPWYDRALDELDRDYQKQTFGERSLVERWFGILKHRTTLFWHRFPHNSSLQPAQKWIKSFNP